MKGILHLVEDQVRPVIAWQSWPQELAQDWLGLDRPPHPPPLPENVRSLLEQARPFLVSGHYTRFSHRELPLSPRDQAQ